MKKTRFLFSLLMAIVMMAMSPMKIWAQEQNLQFVAASAGFTNEGTRWDPEIPENLVDGRTDTKWCYNFPGDGVTYIIVKASEAKTLTSYLLVEGGDTYRETGRHWKAWTIYGGNFGSDEAATNDAAEWTAVHSVTDNLYENHVSIFNAVGNEQAYQYYKIVVEEINGGNLHQMAEIYFTFKACDHSISTEYPATEATAEAHGNGAYKVCDLCGAYLDANGNEIAFPVLHYFDAEHTHACVEPTCTVAGSIAYKECVVCSAIFDMDNNPVSDTEIAATGHTFNSEGICTTCELVCEHTEYKYFDAEVHKCTVCQHAESHVINEETSICSVCGHAHDFSSKTLTDYPVEDGLYAYVCEICEAHSDAHVIKDFNGEGNHLELAKDGEGNYATSEDITLADGASFSSPVDFTANSVTYTRTGIKNQFGTLVVPFDVNGIGADYDLYKLDMVCEFELVLRMVDEDDNGGIVPAGTPVVFRLHDDLARDYSLTLTANNTTVSGQLNEGPEADGLQLVGTYETIELNENDYFISNNMFWCAYDAMAYAWGVKVAPFRAYLKSTWAGARASSLSISIGDETNDIDVLNAIAEGEAEYYDMNGNRTGSLQDGVNIVKYGNGKTKKVIIK